jgi:hypothetical protein
MAKKNKAPKESSEARRERIALSGAMTTKVVKDKKKYSRKSKHKSNSDLCFF